MGKIFFAVDGGLYNAVHEMFVKDHGLEPLISICSPHNWGNATKRALNENLVRYLPDGASTIEVIFFSNKFGSILDRSLFKYDNKYF